MPRGIDDIDRLVGRNIRIFRTAKNLSQTDLGRAIGITFQQIQKYENGTNRVGAGRLMAIATTLDTPVERFFDAGRSRSSGGGRSPDVITELLAGPQALETLRALGKIKDVNIRRSVLALLASIGTSRT